MAKRLEGGWSHSDLAARIERHGLRYPAGSPDEHEVAVYRDCMNEAIAGLDAARVLVLGMTPELRIIASRAGAELVAIDSSRASIDLYGDWVAANGANAIVEARWQDVKPVETGRFHVVMGDGIFPNILTWAGQEALLANVRDLLMPGGVAVFRQPLVPDDIDSAHWRWRRLSARFHEGRIDANEFGLSARLWGLWHEPNVADGGLLDNAEVFAGFEKLHQAGELTEEALSALNRFRYEGCNLFQARGQWEEMLTGQGLTFERRTLRGRLWYEYYPIYRITSCHG